MKYVILSPNVTFYAFGKCYPVSKTTKDFVFYIKTNEDNSWEERVSKKNILFFSDKDISEKIEYVNSECYRLHKELRGRLESYRLDFKEIYESK